MSPPVWVFGYGSLIWRPGFDYADSKIGYITGYKRRFWQGNDVHRGTKDRVGRVVTLIDADSSEQTWGRAFQMSDERTCRQYLDNREATLGGYATRIVTFTPSDPREEPFPVLIYIALPSNSLYLGPAKYNEMAYDIAESSGICGPNVEYLANLAAFMRSSIPNVYDEHLFKLEASVKNYLLLKSNFHLLEYFEHAIETDRQFSNLNISDDDNVNNNNYKNSNINNNSNKHIEKKSTAKTKLKETEMERTSTWKSSLKEKVTTTGKKFHFTDIVPNRSLRCVTQL